MVHDHGLLYLVTDNGGVACREAVSGKLVWETKRALADCSASPVLNEGKLYVLDEKGTCIIFAAGRECKVLATNTLADERTLSSMAVADGFKTVASTHVLDFFK